MNTISVQKIAGHRPPAELFTAVSRQRYPFFLDSAVPGGKLSRFSFLGCEPFLIFKSKGSSVSLEWADGKRESYRANPFLALKDILKRYELKKSVKALPFVSGCVGYFSYDMKCFIEDLPDIAKDDLGIPDCVMGFYDTVLAHDNHSGETYVSGLRPGRIKELKERIASRPSGGPGRYDGRKLQLRSNFSKSGYIKAILRAKEHIRKGDIYQVNLSQRFEAGISTDPVSLYLKLRVVSPAPFAAYLGFEDVSVLSSSPERFIKKTGRRIETRPIKGTRPRGSDKKADLAFERELKMSVKDNAEHIMIVDLERNDLGRVCDYGTVKPAGPAVIERYANVLHLVSTVSGRVKKGVGAIDCLMAAFPGGSITGAPKVRSMEIIEELESVKRSIYTGAIGYVSFDGDMDMSIAIRTLILKGGKAYFSVGGGIVADSVPEDEYQETLDKARGLVWALEGA